MYNTFIRIDAVLLVIFLLPAVFFSVYQINSLNKNELIIEEIYHNQLDAILFSVNQYSADVLNAWAADVDLLLDKQRIPDVRQLNQFFLEKPDIEYLFLVDSADFDRVLLFTEGSGQARDDSLSVKISRTLAQRELIVGRLLKYLDEGYRKIEPLAVTDDRLLKMQVFLSSANVDSPYICGFLIRPESFIQGKMGPKIQAISQEKFVISVFRDEDNYQVYTTAADNDGQQRRLYQSPFWLFSDYHLSIDLNGQTIEALARDRAKNDLFLMIGMNILILLGIWFVFRNIKRELTLAQIKSDSVSNVSHEIRTPLSLISMFTETLQINRVRSEAGKLYGGRVTIGRLSEALSTYDAKARKTIVKMSHKEFEVLKYLWMKRQQTVSRFDLLDNICGYKIDQPTTRTVDNFIDKLRQKIEQNPNEPQIILTLHGIGYKKII